MAYTKLERIEKAVESWPGIYIVYTACNKNGWDYGKKADPPVMVGFVGKPALMTVVEVLRACPPTEFAVQFGMLPYHLVPAESKTDRVTVSFGVKAGDIVLKAWSTRDQSDRYRTRKMVNLGVVVQSYAHTMIERMVHMATCETENCSDCKSWLMTAIDKENSIETLKTLKKTDRVYKALSETIDGLQQLQL
jgi:hypothetical protein